MTIEKTAQVQHGNCHETFAKENSARYHYSLSYLCSFHQCGAALILVSNL
jgi:hypothetical protein